MAQFIAFNQDVEVNTQTILSVVNSMKLGQNRRLDILLKSGIDPEKEDWFKQQKWLNSFKVIGETLGQMNLFLIGKAVIDNAKFPVINDLEEGLRGIDVAFHMNHRLNGQVMFDPVNGKMLEGIGHYDLVDFDAQNRKATMVCTNSYPSKFDEGIITQMVRKFKPKYALEKIELDLTKESRLDGAESCTFLISW